jgi:SAM-dependent methyltransferase
MASGTALNFQGKSAALADRYMLPFPAQTLDILRSLIPGGCQRVLDVGCGTGAFARPLACFADVQALDPSAEMLEVGKTMPGGSHPALAWKLGRAEDTELAAPFGLILAARSFHLLDWDAVLPRFARLLAPDGRLAIVYVHERGGPDLSSLRGAPIANPRTHNYNWLATLRERGLFERHGWQRTGWAEFRTSFLDFTEGCHALRGYSREEMGWAASLEFDTALGEILAARYPLGQVEMEVAASVVWGRPTAEFPQSNSDGS